jgi:hypothetical protein
MGNDRKIPVLAVYEALVYSIEKTNRAERLNEFKTALFIVLAEIPVYTPFG